MAVGQQEVGQQEASQLQMAVGQQEVGQLGLEMGLQGHQEVRQMVVGHPEVLQHRVGQMKVGQKDHQRWLPLMERRCHSPTLAWAEPQVRWEAQAMMA